MTIASALRPTLLDSTPSTALAAIAITTIEMTSSISVDTAFAAAAHGQGAWTNPLSALTVNANGPTLMFWSPARLVRPSASKTIVTAGDAETPVGLRAREDLPVRELHVRGPRRVRQVARPGSRRLLASRRSRRA